jgi:hypothetical protein
MQFSRIPKPEVGAETLKLVGNSVIKIDRLFTRTNTCDRFSYAPSAVEIRQTSC